VASKESVLGGDHLDALVRPVVAEAAGVDGQNLEEALVVLWLAVVEHQVADA
jgi:hypothetical protein